MATSRTSTRESESDEPAPTETLYERSLREVPPPPTPTQAELDQMAEGTYAGTEPAATKRSEK